MCSYLIHWNFADICLGLDKYYDCAHLQQVHGLCLCFIYMQILETPSLLADGSTAGKRNIFKQAPAQDAAASGCC